MDNLRINVSVSPFRNWTFLGQNLKKIGKNLHFDVFFIVLSRKKKMVAIGSLSKKLTVHATDDVYKATKEKMALAEEESKRNW